MTLKEFLEKHKEDPRGYCPCVVDVQGDVYECPRGHLDALLNLNGKNMGLEDIPRDVSPLFYMLAETGAVVVDFENQVYHGELTGEQLDTLEALGEAGMITPELKGIHGSIRL